MGEASWSGTAAEISVLVEGKGAKEKEGAWWGRTPNGMVTERRVPEEGCQREGYQRKGCQRKGCQREGRQREGRQRKGGVRSNIVAKACGRGHEQKVPGVAAVAQFGI